MAKKKPSSGEGTSTDPAAKPYVVLARKYRPQRFEDLIGQEAMVRTLRNAFAAGRIAQGYMLTGVRGVGKTTTARILARALNYETDAVSTPSIDMPVIGRHCAEIIESRHPDVMEIDAASHTGIDNIREIIEASRYLPMLARTKVYVIDEVHMLSKGAFNALLKTLEEPPEHVKFIFATTEVRKVPVTVLSRCQRFDLRRVDVPELSRHLAHIATCEGVNVEDDAIAMIARAAGGSVRDGLSLLDQAIATGSGTVSASTVRDMIGLADRSQVFDLIEAVLGGAPAKSLELFAQMWRNGADPVQILTDLAAVVHFATRVKVMGSEPASEGYSAEERRRAEGLAAQASMPLLARAWQMLLKGMEESSKAPDPSAACEMVLVRMAYIADLPPPDEIIRAMGADGAQGRAAAQPAQTAATARTSVRAHDGKDAMPETASLPERESPRAPAMDVILDDDPRYSSMGSDAEVDEDPDPDPGVDPIEGLSDSEDDGAVSLSSGVRTFEDVVALARARRDAKLSVHLDEHVSLVRFDAQAGSIDLYLLEGAPPEMANDLREKLNRWTGRRWVVMLSKSPGDLALAEVRRQREAAELETLRKHPAVAAVFETFPDAKITLVRPAADHDQGDGTATG